jgi:hypothetical protein
VPLSTRASRSWLLRFQPHVREADAVCLCIGALRANVRTCRRSGVSCGRAAMIRLWRRGPGELAPHYAAGRCRGPSAAGQA